MAKRSSTAKPASAESDIPLGTWKALYELAQQIQDLQPWQYLSDSDLFAVCSPAGEPGYCVVLGELDELLGLVVYLGATGYAGYRYLRDKQGPPDAGAMLAQQRCVMVTFEGRAEQRPYDLAVIKSLGLRFRGAQAWPCFRSYCPGYLPWRLAPEEAELLQLTLEQALIVLRRTIEKPATLRPPVPGQLLTRVLKDGVWTEQWLAPETSIEPDRRPPFDPARVQAVLALNRPRRDTWQLGLLHPGGIVDDGRTRPFPMRLAMLVQGEAGLVLSADVLLPGADAQGLAESILNTLEEAPVWPTKLLLPTGDEPICALLQPLGQALHLKVERSSNLPTLRSAMDALSAHLG